MTLDSRLLEILACPTDKQGLLYFEDEAALYNPRLQRTYRVDDDIPVMLIDEALAVDDAEHTRLMAKADADGVSPRPRRPAGAGGARRRSLRHLWRDRGLAGDRDRRDNASTRHRQHHLIAGRHEEHRLHWSSERSSAVPVSHRTDST